MASLAEREALRGKVQMVYIDPPYGIRFGSNWQVSARKRDVKDGKLEDATREVEQIKAFRDTWELGIHSYLSYLRDRLVAARELLTDSGSCFVQIGDENVHLVRSLMDEVFGSENFVSQITFKKTNPLGASGLPSVGDYIVWYCRDAAMVKTRQLLLEKRLGRDGVSGYAWAESPDGNRKRLSGKDFDEIGNLGAGWRVFAPTKLTAAGLTPSCVYEFEFEGRQFRPNPGSSWRTNADGMRRVIAANRLIALGSSIYQVMYFDDFPVTNLTNLWTDTRGEMGSIYVVQTATRIVERCMLMCTDPGDLVLDPTCGSGTTAYVAEQWGRRWITVDTSRVALALARQRLMGARFPYYLLADTPEGRAKESELTATPLPPAPTNGDIRHGFVYRRVPHVTLKSIANNPDIVEGMSREEIDAAIRRHADFELLYDQPYEDRRKVRVTGPFTVESLSPHRSIAFADTGEPATVREAAVDPDAPTFEQTILANLASAGIQNGRKQERLTFAEVEPYAGTFLQAVGVTAGTPDGDASAEASERAGANAPGGDGPAVTSDGDVPAGTSSADGAERPRRVGICVGPQYGTVSPAFIKGAAREAIAAGDVDVVAVLGFAFDPTAIGATDDVASSDEGFAEVARERKVGRMPVLLVRMNSDLSMGEELKKTGAGNLFTVFGEPDIDVRRDGDEVVVELRGVDVFDPTTGVVRSDGPDRIALWMIDTDYNAESFFVRHCYFTGGQDPYKRLKTALKADIDADAWATLNATTSRPFPVPSTGRIAVKVINDYGDEVLQVFQVPA
jgi:adenine-specific DNA-methyltransferase